MEKRIGDKHVTLPDITLPTTAVILADGLYPMSGPAAEILRSAPRVVCCDGAANRFVVRRMRRPEAIVGDCDSLSAWVRHLCREVVHQDDDQLTNDLTKAVGYCVGQGATDIVILGATGRREDHTLGNISLLCDYARRANVAMVTDNGVFIPMTGRRSFESFAGQQASIFVLNPGSRVVYEGLKYPLPEERLRSWWQGTLNESLGEVFTIECDGDAIVFRAFEGAAARCRPRRGRK
ncbi:MAG: thiamine diphosphokinase [Rikenellaceae bacterium]|jgi:thiamine pyrophosphokinase|nr:thiamine diphosphokinase [Rikenellaceae bacterium]